MERYKTKRKDGWNRNHIPECEGGKNKSIPEVIREFEEYNQTHKPPIKSYGFYVALVLKE